MLAIEPALRNVVSGVRYLPKVADAVQEVPSREVQLADYDHAAREIRFDRKFLQSGPRAHVEASTGAQPAGETGSLQSELEKIRVQLSVKLVPLAAEHVIAGPVEERVCPNWR